MIRKLLHQNAVRRFRKGAGVLFLVFSLLVPAGMHASAIQAEAGSRDILWQIASACIDTSAKDYCRHCQWPRAEAACPNNDGACRNTTDVWVETPDYVAIRDIKMCGCAEGFVHGLAIPRTRVTGIEDPHRPEGIWQFAWDAALQRINNPSDIALVVNPARLRSQDQLHVHIVRLKEGARKKWTGLPGIRLADLTGVWRAARKAAADAGLKDYGMLVAAHPGGGFMVWVEDGSPELQYTEARCP